MNLPTRNNPVQLDFQRMAKPLQRVPKPSSVGRVPSHGVWAFCKNAVSLTPQQKSLLLDGLIIITWFTICLTLLILV